jgi:voltage-dependent potassium channel beta subunit
MEMEYHRLGNSGLMVGALSMGSWLTFGDREMFSANEKLMHMAYDAGVNFFDNAEGYEKGRAEEVMGEILHKSGWGRDTYIVSSKVFFGTGGKRPTQVGLSRKHVVEACHAALKRLRVEYLDLYFCHRPDKKTPVAETVWTMNDLMRQGKILYWGTSEWPAKMIAEACEFARENNLVGPTMEQPQYNILCRVRFEQEYAGIFRTEGLGATIWSPLGSGLLSGKYNDGIPEGSRLAKEQWLTDRLNAAQWKNLRERLVLMGRLARELGVAQSTLAIAWCLKKPYVSTVILGATKPDQLAETLSAVEIARKLDDGIMARIETMFPIGLVNIADREW